MLILAAITYFRGTVPGFLAALYCLLLTVGCVVIFYRNTPPSRGAWVAMQVTVSRQRLLDMSGPCAALAGQSRPIPVRKIVCPDGGASDCTATLDVPADQVRALLAAGQPPSVPALIACE